MVAKVLKPMFQSSKSVKKMAKGAKASKFSKAKEGKAEAKAHNMFKEGVYDAKAEKVTAPSKSAKKHSKVGKSMEGTGDSDNENGYESNKYRPASYQNRILISKVNSNAINHCTIIS